VAEGGPLIDQVEALLRRFTPEGRRQARRARERRWAVVKRIVKRLAMATLAILFAAIAWGIFIGPLGAEGAMLVLLGLLIAWIAIPWFGRAPVFTSEKLVQSDLRLLPARTGEWLGMQRQALPAPAQRLIDAIEDRLEAIAPQLDGLDQRTPAAAALRKLIGEELPELVDGYRRVPPPLRREARNGTSPDVQLLDGLRTVDAELGRMSTQLASGDLDKLATQRRFLEIKYRDETNLRQ